MKTNWFPKYEYGTVLQIYAREALSFNCFFFLVFNNQPNLSFQMLWEIFSLLDCLKFSFEKLKWY